MGGPIDSVAVAEMRDAPAPKPDVFRREYRPLTDAQKAALDRIKDRAQELYDDYNIVFEEAASGRAMSLAKTNLEQSVMWAVKAITG